MSDKLRVIRLLESTSDNRLPNTSNRNEIPAVAIGELFNNINSLRTKWGDTVFKLTNEDGTVDLKVDLRVIMDETIQMRHVGYGVYSGEFSNFDPSSLQYQSDTYKVVIEGKNIINQLVSHSIDICNNPVLQICGSEIHVLEVSLAAPEFREYPKLKNECVVIGDKLKDHLITVAYKEGPTKSQNIPQVANNKKH